MTKDLAARLEELVAEARAAGALGALADPLSRAAREACVERAAGAKDDPELDVPMRFGIVGGSEAMAAVHERIARVAPSPLSVLVRGETGTGKELVARALHDASDRAQGPFLAENCAAVPAGLLESELFGHKKGAFTDAVRDREGHFQAADGGTLFLDEIGDMPLELQSKLLRVLEESEVRPVGSNEVVKVDVRIVAATHQDLAEMVRERRFREDLLYRLDVVGLTLPPLRTRNGDVEHLARYFLRTAAEKAGRPVPVLEDEALRALAAYAWPGNVRQLENEILRAVALAPGERVGLEDLSPDIQDAARDS